MPQISIEEFIRDIPKAELHLHIEGSFEPELMFEIAQRNNLSIPYNSVQEVKDAYVFNNLQEFLDIYYQGAAVLIAEQDFYDLTWAYLTKSYEQGVTHVEVFFDPQTHTSRGVSFETVIDGIHKALVEGESHFGITSRLIMCFLRHLDQESAFATLEMALPYKDRIIAVGLDSSELGNPPSKFQEVFTLAKRHGFLTVAHAGEEGPASYIHEAISLLGVSRIDHGNKCLDDPELVKLIANHDIPLTLCPLSNVELKVVSSLDDYPVLEMLEKGICVTLNSDDPAYFGGYMYENLLAVANALSLDKRQITELCINSFKASFQRQDLKLESIEEAIEYFIKHK